MIEEQAKVIKVEGEFAWVETQRTSTCSACSVNKGCGTAALSKVIGNRSMQMRALNHARARIGDQVVVGVDESALVRGSLIVYAIPLVAMFAAALLGAGMFAAWRIEYTEGYRIGLSLLGLLVGFAVVARFSRSVVRDSRFQAVVLRQSESVVGLYEIKSEGLSQKN